MIAQRRRKNRLRLTLTQVFLVLLVSVWFFVAGPELAHACSNSGQSLNGYSYSSQLTATAIFVCNSNSTNKTTSTAATGSQTTLSCSSTTQAVWTGPPTYQVKRVRVTTCGKTLIVKNVVPPPPTPSAAKTPASTSSSALPAADQSGFSPEAITLSADRASANPGQLFSFVVGTAVHFKVGTILGQAVTVRFTPAVISWDFGEGPMPDQPFDSSAATRHAFANTGSQLVLANVKFLAAYRFAGQTNWTSETGYLGKSATTTVVVGRVSSQPATPVLPDSNPSRRIRLVTADCRLHPSAPGCR
jgi:hypothetical protein